MEAVINSLLGAFLTWLLLYKYWAIFLIAFVATTPLPLPASTVLAAAGAFASQGYMNIYAVVAIALLGNVLGDLTMYWIAKRYGIALLEKIGLRKFLRSGLYTTLKQYILDVPETIIYFTRFMSEMGPLTTILAGITEVPFAIFFIYDVLGELSYVLLYVLVGYFLGNAWQDNISFLAEGALVIVAIGVVINIGQVLFFRRRKTRGGHR